MGIAVTVLDYGIGNLLNVVRALQHEGAVCSVVSRAEPLTGLAERVVLPGVGAFGDGMREMRDRGLDDMVRRFVETGRPFLGICVGHQMLFESSDEFGHHAGLGLLKGRVRSVPNTGLNGEPHRIPHISWSPLLRPALRSSWSVTPLAAVPEGEPAYFVHSFAAEPGDSADRLADTEYDGVTLCAAVQRDNVTGLQFHPERSGPAGLAVLREFLRS